MLQFPFGCNLQNIDKISRYCRNSASRGTSSDKKKIVAATIKEVESDNDEVVAAFAPSASLGNGTDSGGLDIVSRECHGFVNPCRLQAQVGEGMGASWQITTPEKPTPVAWV